jgi:hypothetical protein
VVGGDFIPQHDRQASEEARAAIRRMAERSKLLGVKCPGGIAFLRSGGNIDRDADYYCPNAGEVIKKSP